jgi:hypothetical protein
MVLSVILMLERGLGGMNGLVGAGIGLVIGLIGWAISSSKKDNDSE